MRFLDPRWGPQIQYDPTTLLILGTVATVASVGSQVMAGNAANKAAKQEAGLQREQAVLAQQEANREAQLHAEDRTKFLKMQKLAFLKSGVALEGSPLLVLADTQQKSQEEVNSIVNRGYAQYNLGQKSAQITENKGRAAMIGSYAGAASTAASGIFNATR